MAGINLPSHFMIRPSVEGVELLVDAFHGGEVLCLDEAEQRLSQVMGLNVQLDPRWVASCKPLRPKVFLMRMLNNLKQVYMVNNMLHRWACWGARAVMLMVLGLAWLQSGLWTPAVRLCC